MAAPTHATDLRASLTQDIEATQKSGQEARNQLNTNRNQLQAVATRADELHKTTQRLEQDLKNNEDVAERLRAELKKTKAAKEVGDQNAGTYKAQIKKGEFLVNSLGLRVNTLKDLHKNLASFEDEGYEIVRKSKRTAETAGLGVPSGPAKRLPTQANGPGSNAMQKPPVNIKLPGSKTSQSASPSQEDDDDNAPLKSLIRKDRNKDQSSSCR
ncbi:hypothetical protein LTR97_012521 [Elasticomyces elasticus]|uniref:Uncharacterized protein n=1 Tax=Elasticomyces elasticus TaxID=574655 RepID=A0AAN7ZYV2_9PEZI|nr:hypothetical protein LTR97_012521 [Elasticomyces elasticus]